MTTSPLVSAIVVNWNGARDLETCLPSLLRQSYRRLEIIVVDNASTDDSAEVVERFGVGWLGLDQNVGLAPALNRGASAAAGELLLFLNNDMRFDQEFVTSMVSEMVGRNDVFGVDALQYDWDGKNEVHLATYLALKGSEGDRCHTLTAGLHMCQERRDMPTAVLMASAANMLARKSMFDELGGFDERLFFFYEDVDLCWRGWTRGWKTVFAPGAKCWHHVGHSSHSTSGRSLSFRGIVTGRLVMATKLLPVKYVVKTLLMSMAGLVADVGYLRWQRAADRLAVLNDYLRNVLPLVKERRQIHKLAQTRPTVQLERLLHLRPAQRPESQGPDKVFSRLAPPEEQRSL